MDGHRYAKRTTMLILAATVSAATAQEPAAPAVPSAAAVIARHLENSGGLAAYRKVRNRVTRGTIEYPSFGLTGTLSITAADPGKLKMVTHFEGLGETVEGTDGTQAWLESAIQGPRLYAGRESAFKVRQGVFNPLIKVDQLYTAAACTGVTDVDGTPCHTVVLTPVGSTQQETWYFSVESGLLLRQDQAVERLENVYQLETLLQDYQAVDGVLLPHTRIHRQGGSEVKIVVNSIEHNVDLPADTFAPPTEILELIGGQSAPQSAARPTTQPAASDGP